MTYIMTVTSAAAASSKHSALSLQILNRLDTMCITTSNDASKTD